MKIGLLLMYVLLMYVPFSETLTECYKKITDLFITLLEPISLYHVTYWYKNNILNNFQHSFRPQHSCDSQLLLTVDSLARSLGHHKQTYIQILDFSKDFDTLPHQKLILKLKHSGRERRGVGSVLGL